MWSFVKSEIIYLVVKFSESQNLLSFFTFNPKTSLWDIGPVTRNEPFLKAFAVSEGVLLALQFDKNTLLQGNAQILQYDEEFGEWETVAFIPKPKEFPAWAVQCFLEAIDEKLYLIFDASFEPLEATRHQILYILHLHRETSGEIMGTWRKVDDKIRDSSLFFGSKASSMSTTVVKL